MGVSKKEANEWLAKTREAQKRDSFVYTDHFLIEAHAYYCVCRHLNEKKIVQLLTCSKCSPIIKENPHKKVNSYNIHVNDPDPNLPKNMKKVRLTVLFFDKWYCPIAKKILIKPLIIHGWREGSPDPLDKYASQCAIDHKDPPCQIKNSSKKPQGRI